MPDFSIRVESLSKAYHIGLRDELSDTFFGTVQSWISSPARNLRRLRRLDTSQRNGDDQGILWALRDVSFEINEGEVVGIIGRNGAGKSTLLRILSRITEPTSGRGLIRGRVSSLLEVGTGFHPELTGRENVYMNGTILGMKKREIDRKFDEIVEFSGVEDFLDVPIKRYSSGMQVRLAFSVAAHLEPEILIIDEVLAVGDVEFQKKCLGKMRNVAHGGRTVLFVSHNMQAVSTLTTRSLLLNRGELEFDGATSDVIRQYLQQQSNARRIYANTPASDAPRIVRAELITSDPNGIQRNGEPMSLEVTIDTPHPISQARLACQILDGLDRPIVHLAVFDSDQAFCRTSGTYQLRCRLPAVRLYQGQYRLNLHFASAPHLPKFEEIVGVSPFEVVMHGKVRAAAWKPQMCVYIEDAEWTISEPASC